MVHVTIFTTSTSERQRLAGEAVMKRFLTLLGLSFFVVCFAAKAQVSLIMNGSFEKNGHGIPDITEEAPLFWCDVNIPADKFDAWLDTPMATEGQYALTFSTTMEDVSAGDTATVSQEIFLESDIAWLSFDLFLSSGWPSFFPWDPALRTAFVAVDGDIVWDSNGLEIDENGEYFGTVYVTAVDFGQYLDNNWHKLSLGLRVNQTGSPEMDYYTDIDFVKFDKYCGGFGYLAGDLNQDCYVTLDDLAVLVSSWLSEPANPKDDLYEDGTINNLDFALFAEDWLFNTDWTKWGQDRTFQMERLDLDLDLSGAVDLGEVMVMGEYWLGDGRCAGIELSGDEVVNFKDFAVLCLHWGERDWLYYVE
jgi:hypothetical protein